MSWNENLMKTKYELVEFINRLPPGFKPPTKSFAQLSQETRIEVEVARKLRSGDLLLDLDKLRLQLSGQVLESKPIWPNGCQFRDLKNVMVGAEKSSRFQSRGSFFLTVRHAARRRKAYVPLGDGCKASNAATMPSEESAISAKHTRLRRLLTACFASSEKT